MTESNDVSFLPDQREDVHSYGNASQIRVTHIHLDLDVSFQTKQLRGFATLNLQRSPNYSDGPVVLDTRDLAITEVTASSDGQNFHRTDYKLGQTDKILGTPLTIGLAPDSTSVRVSYATSQNASGLQWLSPAQTAGKKHPFLFTQSQAIHARSWFPSQDSPGVRVTYSANIRTPKQLRAVMSAQNNPDPPVPGEYSFQMPHEIPPYLIALGVGDLSFKPMSKRTGVYAEPPVVQAAAKEFEDTEKMILAAESMYGPYRWQRYDLLILPPSFPFGGMENPMLTFATPTVIAGDKSLVALIAHELAHSWSGNLVTNATWRDFWLNEGFTVYIERRIQEQIFGTERAEMEMALERQELIREMQTLPDADEVLYINLKGRDPDAGFTQVPYVKGALFLRRIEEVFGRSRFDPFLRGYFDHFAFQSITTSDFVNYLNKHLFEGDRDLASRIDVRQWITEPGLPANAPKPHSEAFQRVEAAAKDWLAGKRSLESLPVKDWTTHEWLHFLRSLPEKLERERMADLDRAFGFTRSGNAEIVSQWLLMSIRNGYEPAYARLERFLIEVGRRKFLKPLYTELAKTEAGKQRARAIYRKARPGYHPIAVSTVDEILK